jgi:hypothetical protein
MLFGEGETVNMFFVLRKHVLNLRDASCRRWRRESRSVKTQKAISRDELTIVKLGVGGKDDVKILRFVSPREKAVGTLDSLAEVEQPHQVKQPHANLNSA